MTKNDVSVIIPVLNEEARIEAQLDAVTRWATEVIVVDGGSTDRTVELARRRPTVRVLEAARGRALQMNAGAAAASCEVFLFLHADVTLPGDVTHWVQETLSKPEVVAGAFRTWTVSEGTRSWVVPFLHLADFRSRYTSLPYGDQALFVRASAFRAVGGFPAMPMMEDLALSRKLRKVGAIRTVPAHVQVSGRRFLARPIYYSAVTNLFPLLYRLGVAPSQLAKFYGDPR